MSQKIACIILAAGSGTRMKSDTPKPMHKIAGAPMIKHIIKACEALNPEKIITVIAPDQPKMIEAVAPYDTAIQNIANGTGGAVLAAEDLLKDFNGDILILFGDTPMVTPETLKKIIQTRHEQDGTALVFSAFETNNPTGYGRMILNDDGTLNRIIEHKDTTTEQRKITLCNGGIMCVDGKHLFKWQKRIDNNNAQGEYYMVDLPKVAPEDGYHSRICKIDETETAGVNSRADQARVEAMLQHRLRNKALEAGVTLIAPETIFLSVDTQFGRDVIIHPHVIIGENVKIDDCAEIQSFSHIEGAHIGNRAKIGPYARLRPGTDVGEEARIGNFVEVKNTKLGAGSKASHLTYLGDAHIGAHVNIGAGTITCNYDGFKKHITEIEDGAFIGSNTALIAPVKVGRNAIVAAGSTLTADVDTEALALARAKQVQKTGWAKKFKTSQTSQEKDE